MVTRTSGLQTFIDAAQTAFAAHAVDAAARTSISQSFERLTRPVESSAVSGVRLPVCDKYLGATAVPERLPDPDLARMSRTFLRIEPDLTWRRRDGTAPEASADFGDGHANAMIVGPGGMEPRSDVWLGVSLMAPHVRYPDHTHPPEETYLVMSAGEFSQENQAWFEPGIGGVFFNPPGILHAMRSGPAPLFAFWLLQGA